MTQKTTSLILLFSLLINLFLEKASGHSTGGSSSGGAGGPIFTLSPETLAKGNWSLNLQTQYQLFNSWSDAQLQAKTVTASDSHVHSIDSLSITTISMSYGLLDDITLLAQLPYGILSNIREVEDGEIQNHGNSKGVGDLNLSTKWQAWKDPQNGRAFSFLLGTTLPTGQTHIKDNQGNRFETEHQPGSGAVNPYIGTAFSQQFECDTGFYASVQYQKTFKGAQETRLGDVLNYDIGVVYRLWGEGIPKPLPSSPDHKSNNEFSIKTTHCPLTALNLL